MPILPVEPDQFPGDLLDRPDPNDDRARWWCLHTKPRQEKAAARELRTRRIAFYLPQVRRDGRTPGGRKTSSTLPLFPGYVFMQGDDRQRIETYRTGTLVNILEVADQAGLGRDLRQVARVLASGLPVQLEPTHPVGVRVRIATGPLTGLVGVVARRGPGDRFVAIVEFLGCGATVDLQDWQVERLEADRSSPEESP